MFNVLNIEKDCVVKRCNSHYEAELKLESLARNGKDLDNYIIVPTKEYRFERLDTLQVLYTHTYKIPYEDEYVLEVQKVIEDDTSKYRARLIKKDYGMVYDLGEMNEFGGYCKGVHSEWFHNPHPISESEYVAMTMNQIECDIANMEDDIYKLEQY